MTFVVSKELTVYDSHMTMYDYVSIRRCRKSDNRPYKGLANFYNDLDMKDKFLIILLYFWLLNGIKYRIQFFYIMYVQ